MYRRFVRGIVVVLLALGSLSFVASQPALAASGGGCSNNDAKISACISYDGRAGVVIGDFYMNAYYDPSVYYAYIEIIATNTGSTWYGPYTLNQNGRFGQEWVAFTNAEHTPNPNSLDMQKVDGDTNGQPILASAAGQVAMVPDSPDDGAAWYVRIDHGNGWQDLVLF